MFFYDTCSLLNFYHQIFKSKDKFLISIITLQELENIKTSANKDANVKYKARQVVNLLEDTDLAIVVPLTEDAKKEVSNDGKIIYTALTCDYPDIIFVTSDLCCKHLAAAAGLKTQFLRDRRDETYLGYKQIIVSNDEEINQCYEKILNEPDSFECVLNQYLSIDTLTENIEVYKQTEKGLERVPYPVFNSKMFGKTKPKDSYQLMAMDCLKSNQISAIRGPAGTGKSWLSFTYLFSLLEEQKIDKIIVFCNPVATADSAKLGFYPGSRLDKLLDSQIGNFLISKLGDKCIVEQLIQENKLVLLPMSDIRGYDTTGMRAGIYITEAQNLDIELMRLALQRIGEDCICILDGDSKAQVDLPQYSGNNNGLKRVSEVFRGQDIYGEVTLVNIHRSKIAELAQQL